MCSAKSERRNGSASRYELKGMAPAILNNTKMRWQRLSNRNLHFANAPAGDGTNHQGDDSMKRIALVALIALTGLCSILAAPTKELRMPEQTVMPDGVAFPAAEEEQAGLVEAASASAVAENPVESKNKVVTNQPDRESAEARPSAQADEGWKWNGWKIVSVAFFVLGIMWVVLNVCGGAHAMFQYVTISLFMTSGLLFLFSYVPNVGKIVGGLYLFWLCLIFFRIIWDGVLGKKVVGTEVVQPGDDNSPYLDAGEGGEIRRRLQMEQQAGAFLIT